jgi:hypothetical protein
MQVRPGKRGTSSRTSIAELDNCKVVWGCEEDVRDETHPASAVGGNIESLLRNCTLRDHVCKVSRLSHNLL